MKVNPSESRNTFSYPVDVCMRTLKVPTELQLYIEKHEIFKIFVDLGQVLITKKPKDVLGFMKNHLENYQSDFVPKVILIGSTELDKVTLASYLGHRMNCTPITLRDVYIRKCIEDNRLKENSSQWRTPQSENLSENDDNLDLHETRSTLDAFKSDTVIRMHSPMSNLYDMRDTSIQKEEDVSNTAGSFPNISIQNQEGLNIEQVLNRFRQVDCAENIIQDSKEFIQNLKKIIAECEINRKGWIFVDFPRNKKEAKYFYKDNIIPTHVVSLVSNSIENVHKQAEQQIQLTSEELKHIYGHFLHEIHTCDKNIIQIGEKILSIIGTPNVYFGSEKKRILIIGPQNSGQQFLGDKLAENQKLVHVNMTRNSSNVKNDVVISRLQEFDCLNYGYVLTGFPRNVDELISLEETDISPNRVIFLQLTEGESIPRVKGGHTRNEQTTIRSRLIAELCSNPSDLKYPQDDIKYENKTLYNEQMYAMINYCGKKAVVVEASCDLDTLYARVEEAIEYSSSRIIDKKCEAANLGEFSTLKMKFPEDQSVNETMKP